MKKYKTRSEFIVKENLYQVLWTLSLPLMLNNFIQTLYNLVDAFWLGQLGHEQFAATSFVWPVLYLFISIGMGTSIAGTSILARLIGGRDIERAEEVASHLMVLSLIFAFVFSVIGYNLTPAILNFMGAKGNFFQFSKIYLQIDFLSFPFVMVFFALQSILAAQGNNKAITMANTLAALTNVVLDPFFIFDEFMGVKGLGMGVAGAAYATLLSKVLLAVLGFVILRKGKMEIRLHLRNFKAKANIFHEIFRVALPSTLGQMGSSFGFIILNAAIASYGTITLAAFAMINRATALIIQPAMGIGGSLAAIVGQNLGAGAFSRVKESLKKAILLSLLFTGMGGLLLLIFDKEFIHLFISRSGEQGVIKEALVYLWFSIPTIPLMGFFSVFQGFFQGTGYTKYSMYMDVGRLWLIRLPMIYLFKNYTQLGSQGIWFSMTFSNVAVILYAWWLYRGGKWSSNYKKRGDIPS
ncbi:MAG: MATE family efflux transporter [Tissierellia bacterium]|nr:MATE family efflux transporter [Tissierellia bacterium]